jgi:DNA-binding CsgD family transcriptional regulator/catechol 2,3-dioxygenase-like lactoylglutathione lyase family enzyme
MAMSNRKRGRPPHEDILTPAEWRVVEAVRHGLTNPQIARRRGISVDAVKFHIANAMAKLGFTRRAEIRHWSGISADSLLHAKDSGMTEPLALGPIGQVSRHVTDIAAAIAFYRDTLGLPHLYSFGNLAFFDCGGTRLFLSEGEGTGGDSVLYFRVPDIHAAHATLKERGAEFIDAPHMIHRHEDGTEEWMAFLQDPDGRPLAIMAQVMHKEA